MNNENVKNIVEQYLCDFLDAVFVISEEKKTPYIKALSLPEVKEITPSIILNIDVEVIERIFTLYSTSKGFCVYDAIKKIENMNAQQAIERLKDNEGSFYLIGNSGIKN